MTARGQGDGSQQPRAVPAPRGPFSRPLRIQDVSEKSGADRHVEASGPECDAIAADAGLAAVASLRADFHVARRANGRFDVTGRLDATITEVCVVSLEPFETTLQQDVAISFALPPGRGSRDATGATERMRASAIDIDLEDDSPDPIVDNTIDLGAVALEFLTLARDFYPKKPGVRFADDVVDDRDRQDPSPFAALERFKDRS